MTRASWEVKIKRDIGSPGVYYVTCNGLEAGNIIRLRRGVWSWLPASGGALSKYSSFVGAKEAVRSMLRKDPTFYRNPSDVESL